eukprot:2480943-Amphidinium_carterae.1
MARMLGFLPCVKVLVGTVPYCADPTQDRFNEDTHASTAQVSDKKVGMALHEALDSTVRPQEIPGCDLSSSRTGEVLMTSHPSLSAFPRMPHHSLRT